MAQRVKIILIDDMDESPADEKVKFALDGTNYEIDLSATNAAALRELLAPYVGAGRPVAARRNVRGKVASAPAGASATQIRAWAQENGYEVSARGRVPAQVRKAYELAHA